MLYQWIQEFHTEFSLNMILPKYLFHIKELSSVRPKNVTSSPLLT